MLKDKFAIIVGVFHIHRITEFMRTFWDKNPGADYDLYLVHNSIEPTDIENTYRRSDEEIQQIKDFLLAEKERHQEITIVDRINTGRDLGSLWHGYNLVRDQYKYYFFLNERVKIKQDNWLKLSKDAYDDPKIGAVGIQVCGGHKYPWCLRCFFWSQKDEAIKTMDWWEPKNRADAHIQEMELVYSHVKSLGLKCKQIGNGFNIMNHFLDDGTEDFRYVVNNFEFEV